MAYDYVQAFTEGHSYNQLVAEYLRNNGVRCTVPSLQIAKNNQERKHLTLTEKDITLDGTPHILEVKTSRRKFGWEPKDFPFPNTIVDTVNSYESKERKPSAYILYSRPTGAMIAIGTSTKPKWTKKKLYDNYQELTDYFYMVEKGDMRSMGDLIEYLHRVQQ